MLDNFEKLKSQGEALLIQWKQERKQEGVQLEFKRKDGHDVKMTPADNANLGSCLSGFSNAQGGLVIWGVKATKGEDGIDCVQDLKPFVEFSAFKASVDDKTGPYLMPRHEDIQSIAFPSESDPQKGYVAIRIGSSQLRPHRSEVKDDKRYYRRASSGTYMMEHYEIVDMLRINTVAQMRPAFGAIKLSLNEFEYHCHLDVILVNDGMITAKSPYISFDHDKFDVTCKNMGFNESYLRDTMRMFTGNVNTVINPTLEERVFSILIIWKCGSNRYCHSTDGVVWDLHHDPRPLSFSGFCGCENATKSSFELNLSAHEIASMFDGVRADANADFAERRWRADYGEPNDDYDQAG